MNKRATHDDREFSFDEYLSARLKNRRFRSTWYAGLDPFQLGVEISKLRRRKGLTQIQLAKKVGVSSRMVSSLEKGGNARWVTLATLSRLAAACEVELIIFFR